MPDEASVNCTAAPTPGEVGEYENEAAGAAGVPEEGGAVEGGVEPCDDPSPQPVSARRRRPSSPAASARLPHVSFIRRLSYRIT